MNLPLSALKSAELELLNDQSKQYVFKKGDYLFKSGDSVKGIFCITAGVVSVTQASGRKEVTIRLATTDDWVGHRSVFTSETYRGSAKAKGLVQASFIPTDLLYRFFGTNREFAHRLIRLIARDLEATERLLLESHNLTVPSRLISLFQKLDRQIGAPHSFGRVLAATISKVEIADMIGASQEVVSRQLSKWKKAHLVYEDQKKIILSQRLLDRIIQ